MEGQGGEQQEGHLREEGGQAQHQAPLSLCRQVQHVEVRREVVADVPPRQVVQVCLVEEVPTVSAHQGSYVRREKVVIRLRCKLTLDGFDEVSYTSTPHQKNSKYVCLKV